MTNQMYIISKVERSISKLNNEMSVVKNINEQICKEMNI